MLWVPSRMRRAHLTTALERGRQLGSDHFQARAHLLLSLSSEHQGRTHDAPDTAEHALRLARDDLRHPDAEQVRARLAAGPGC